MSRVIINKKNSLLMYYVSFRFGCFYGNECAHEEKNRLKVCNPYDKFAFFDILTDSFSGAIRKSRAILQNLIILSSKSNLSTNLLMLNVLLKPPSRSSAVAHPFFVALSELKKRYRNHPSAQYGSIPRFHFFHSFHDAFQLKSKPTTFSRHLLL